MTATPIAIAVPPSKAPRAAAGTAAGIDPFILPDLPVAATPEAPASAAPADDNAEDGSGADAGHSGIDTAIALATLQTASPLPEAAPPSPAASLHEMQQAAAAAPATSEQAQPAAAPTLLPAGSAAGQPAPEARTPAALPAATASESAPEPAGVTDMPRPATATQWSGQSSPSSDSGGNGGQSPQSPPFRIELAPPPSAATGSTAPPPSAVPASTATTPAHPPAEQQGQPRAEAPATPDITVRLATDRLIDVTIAVSTDESRQRLDAARPELAHALAELGTKVEAIRVELRTGTVAEQSNSPSTGKEARDQEQPQARSGPNGGASDERRQTSRNTTAEREARLLRVRPASRQHGAPGLPGSTRRIDLYA